MPLGATHVFPELSVKVAPTGIRTPPAVLGGTGLKTTRVAVLEEREPPFVPAAVPVTPKVRTVSAPPVMPLVATVTEVAEPASVGVTLLAPRVEVAPDDNPETVSPIAGTPIVEDPDTSFKVRAKTAGGPPITVWAEGDSPTVKS